MSVRLGLIGAGRWGRRFLATVPSVPQARLVSLATRVASNASLVGDGVELTSDWRALCRSEQVDGVIIATPPSTHPEMLRACLAARKPALVEKPLCLGLGPALELEREVRASGLPVLVDHTFLFHPAFEEMLRQCREPGEVRWIHAEGRAWGPFRAEKVPVLWDRGPHDVAMCLALMRALPVAVTGLAAWTDAPPAVDAQMITLRLEFREGAVAWIEIGHLASQKRRRFSVFTADRTLVFEDGMPEPLIAISRPWRFEGGQAEAPRQTLEVERELPLNRVLREFVAGVAGRPSKRFGLALAVDVARVLEAAGRAVANPGQAISVGEALSAAPAPSPESARRKPRRAQDWAGTSDCARLLTVSGMRPGDRGPPPPASLRLLGHGVFTTYGCVLRRDCAP